MTTISHFEKEYFDNLTTIHSTRSLHCKQTFGGILLRRTRMVCKITLEKRGPISTNSSNLHISPHILHQIYQTIWLFTYPTKHRKHTFISNLLKKKVNLLAVHDPHRLHPMSEVSLEIWHICTSGKMWRPTDNELTMLRMVSKILLLVPLSWKTYITEYHTGYFENT